MKITRRAFLQLLGVSGAAVAVGDKLRISEMPVPPPVTKKPPREPAEVEQVASHEINVSAGEPIEHRSTYASGHVRMRLNGHMLPLASCSVAVTHPTNDPVDPWTGVRREYAGASGVRLSVTIADADLEDLGPVVRLDKPQMIELFYAEDGADSYIIKGEAQLDGGMIGNYLSRHVTADFKFLHEPELMAIV